MKAGCAPWGVIAAAALATATAGCVETVEVSELLASNPEYSIDGYDDPANAAIWSKIEVSGIAPGHGDTYREIFYNDVARSYGHAGEYPIGTLLVKDIYSLEDRPPEDKPSYTAVMRKIGPDDAPGNIELEGGWLFTFIEEERGEGEFTISSCYQHCHVQAPLDYVWYDYGL